MPSHAAPTLEALARQSLAACHTDLLAARLAVLRTRDPDAIHRTRVALRRIRAAATLFGRALRDERFLVLRGDARQLADACGATRDLDVFLAGALKEAEAELAPADTAGELRAFRAAAIRRRRSRHDAARQVLDSEIFAVFDARLTRLLAEPAGEPLELATPLSSGPGVAEPGDRNTSDIPDAMIFAREVLRRRHRKLRKKLDRFDQLDGAQRHALRLRVKRQRYGASFLAPLFDRKQAASYVQAAASIQDALGLANDRLVAVEVVADIRSVVQPKGRLDWCAGALTGWLTARARANDDDRAIASAVKRFTRAPRFWRHGGRGGDGEQNGAATSAAIGAAAKYNP